MAPGRPDLRYRDEWADDNYGADYRTRYASLRPDGSILWDDGRVVPEMDTWRTEDRPRQHARYNGDGRRLLATLPNGAAVYDESGAPSEWAVQPRPMRPVIAAEPSLAEIQAAGGERYPLLASSAVQPAVLAASLEALDRTSRELEILTPNVAWFARRGEAGSAAIGFVEGPAAVNGWVTGSPEDPGVLYVRVRDDAEAVVETIAHEAAHARQIVLMGVVRDEADRADREARAERYSTRFRAEYKQRAALAFLSGKH